MKLIKSIFVFVFLLSMVYTIFQYLPLTEEESQNQNTELCKKSSENDSSDDDSNETDSDNDDNELSGSLDYLFIKLDAAKYNFIVKNNFYNFRFQKINIKPPKI